MLKITVNNKSPFNDLMFLHASIVFVDNVTLVTVFNSNAILIGFTYFKYSRDVAHET